MRYHYHFHHPDFGPCYVTPYLSGKHGFALPKKFLISVASQPELGAFSYFFFDRALRAVDNARNEDARRMRIAISQFIRDNLGVSGADLDLSIEPFAGEVRNGRGDVLLGDSFQKVRDAVLVVE